MMAGALGRCLPECKVVSVCDDLPSLLVRSCCLPSHTYHSPSLSAPLPFPLLSNDVTWAPPLKGSKKERRSGRKEGIEGRVCSWSLGGRGRRAGGRRRPAFSDVSPEAARLRKERSLPLSLSPSLEVGAAALPTAPVQCTLRPPGCCWMLPWEKEAPRTKELLEEISPDGPAGRTIGGANACSDSGTQDDLEI